MSKSARTLWCLTLCLGFGFVQDVARAETLTTELSGRLVDRFNIPKPSASQTQTEGGSNRQMTVGSVSGRPMLIFIDASGAEFLVSSREYFDITDAFAEVSTCDIRNDSANKGQAGCPISGVGTLHTGSGRPWVTFDVIMHQGKAIFERE